MSVLRDQQRAFAARVFSTYGFDGHTLNGDGFEDNASKLLALKHQSDNHFSDAQRFQIYRSNSAIGLRLALAGVYPVINKLVGDEFFQHVAREYIQQYPAHDGNVHEFGHVFSEFLASFPGANTLAYLPDVARLEWAHHQVFHASELAVLNIQALASLENLTSESLRFQVSKCCRLLSSVYPVLSIWQANQAGNENQTVDLEEGSVQFVVVRKGLDVEFRPLNEAFFSLLLALSKGKTFAGACEEALRFDVDSDVGAMLKSLIEQRLLTGFSC